MTLHEGHVRNMKEQPHLRTVGWYLALSPNISSKEGRPYIQNMWSADSLIKITYLLANPKSMIFIWFACRFTHRIFSGCQKRRAHIYEKHWTESALKTQQQHSIKICISVQKSQSKFGCMDSSDYNHVVFGAGNTLPVQRFPPCGISVWHNAATQDKELISELSERESGHCDGMSGSQCFDLQAIMSRCGDI